jgi:murein DD-endopeptidase MepM/ murein hydrolase activator NlpD
LPEVSAIGDSDAAELSAILWGMRIPAAPAPRLLVALFLCLFAGGPVPGGPVASLAQSLAMTLTPALVEAGSPELIRVEAPATATLEGEWMGRKLDFFRGRGNHAWFALAGVDVEAAVGPSTLRITVTPSGGDARDLARTIEIHAAHYRTGSLTVAPKFVEPGPEALKQIETESQLKAKVFAASAEEPLWTSSFRTPVTAAPTDSFGTRRMFNGKLASIHKGMDFRAAMGTPVRASNGGVVVLARPLYYEGNCVVIDHGLGLFTLSMHFSRIDVHEGQRVVAGERLGLSGATGRVTGPHLHWAVRWQDAYVDPGKLLRLDLKDVR